MARETEKPSFLQSRLNELFPKLAARSDPAMAQLTDHARLVTLEADQFVFRNGDLCHSFLLLLDGKIRVQLISENGREITLYRIHSGSSCILTTSCLLSTEQYPAEAITETAVTAAAMPRALFEGLLQTSQEFRNFVFDGFSSRLTDVIARIEQLALTSIDARLAAALIELGSEGESRVTHQQLATELGTAREVVSRKLKSFEAEGLVRLGRSRVTVLDRAALQERSSDRGASTAPTGLRRG